MDYSTIKNICNAYRWGKSIDTISDEYMIPVEGITRVLEINGLLKKYEEDSLPKGQLMKSIDVIIAYCPECGETVYLDSMCDKRVNSDGKEEWLCSCGCGCDFWAYEDYAIDEHNRQRAEKRDQLAKLSKEELINMIVR